MDGRRIRNNKVAFSNLSDIVWTGPQLQSKIFANFSAAREAQFQKTEAHEGETVSED